MLSFVPVAHRYSETFPGLSKLLIVRRALRELFSHQDVWLPLQLRHVLRLHNSEEWAPALREAAEGC